MKESKIKIFAGIVLAVFLLYQAYSYVSQIDIHKRQEDNLETITDKFLKGVQD